MKTLIYNIKTKNFSDSTPTPNQEGADYDLKNWIEEHPGQAKYIAELGAKWGVDNILEGLEHDMNEGEKTFSRGFSDDRWYVIARGAKIVLKSFDNEKDANEWADAHNTGSIKRNMVIKGSDAKAQGFTYRSPDDYQG
jgi:hypothetical protein